MISVFCTRLLPEEEQTKARLSGIHLTCKRFIRIRPQAGKATHPELLPQLHHPHLTLLFTSKNAVHIAFAHYLNKIPELVRSTWRFYCLSGATRTALLSYCDPRQILASAPHAQGLIERVRQPPLTEPVHFFCGNRRRDTLPGFLTQQGYRFKEWIVYQTELTPHRLTDTYDAYLFYSPSAVESFLSVNPLAEDNLCFAIGSTTAAALKKRFPGRVYESNYPDTDHLLTLIRQHLPSHP